LPLSWQCDHSIPLIPRAQPFYIRPYRYPQALKDKIERQVQDMLSQGLIQPSNSMFSSLVLLVKKKDQSYRFCVDFRKLNAMTVKSKYPVPVIDQLLDELHQASWFTKLDLRAGFH
jgi:tRNA A37 N6-isopentenylltransferase MiaA